MVQIYTSILGGVDSLADAPKLNNVHFQCYANSKIKAANYSIYKVDEVSNPWLDSRKFKVLSHHYQKHNSLWIDGRVEVKENILDFIKQCSDSDFTLFPHPFSNSIEEEAQRCLNLGLLENKRLVESQIGKYHKEGFSDGQLMAGGIIFRKNTESSKAINELWWKELNEFPTRDEISLPYVLWKLGLKVKVLDLNIFNNPYFNFNTRRQGDRF